MAAFFDKEENAVWCRVGSPRQPNTEALYSRQLGTPFL